jgi:hypothetical protein
MTFLIVIFTFIVSLNTVLTLRRTQFFVFTLLVLLIHQIFIYFSNKTFLIVLEVLVCLLFFLKFIGNI